MQRTTACAELVVKALDECLKTHGFEDLTITELCQVSTIGRATFYRLFDDPQDVVSYKCELLAQEFSSGLFGANIKEMQRQFFKMWMENSDFLKLIVALHRTDIILDCHRKHLEAICDELKKGGAEIDLNDYYMIMLTNILVGSLLVWCEHGCREETEELIANIKKAVSDIGLLLG